jgi:NTE family protein
VKQADAHGLQLVDEQGKPFRYCPITVVRPKAPLGDTLDFSQAAIRMRMRAGEEAARLAVQPVHA